MHMKVKQERFSLKCHLVMFLREVEKECLKLEYLCLCSLLDFTQLSRDNVCFDCSLTKLFWVLHHLSTCLCLPLLAFLRISAFLSVIIIMFLPSECSSTDL